jgi:hypothetical protein
MVLFLRSGSKSSKVLGTGGLDGGLINWDNSAVGVSNKTAIGGSVGSTGEQSVGGKVISAGSLDGGLVNRDDSAIGVSDETAIGSSVGSGGIGNGGVGSGKVVVGVWVSQAVVGIGVAIGSKVGSFGSLDLRGLDWGNSSVGVGDKLGAGSSHASKENLKQ